MQVRLDVRWPKRVNHKSVTKTQNNFPKHKSISQNTNRFLKTQINFSKHEPVCQNTNQFRETQINFPKHKLVSQNTNRFLKTQINFSKQEPVCQNTNQFCETQINGLGTCSVIIRESLEGTHSQEFPRPTWRLLHVSDNSSSLR